MKQPFSVTIIIPNWNGKELLEKHLASVIKHSQGAKIIVVDDHSDDQSVDFLTNSYPQILIVQKEKHEGFASAVNCGVAAATTDIVILLNSDIEPEKDFLSPLLNHFIDSQVFAVGCMDKSIEHGKIVLRGRGIGRWEKGFYIHKRGEVDKTDTAWVSGGSGAFRRSLWNDLGGMDTIYNPFYWEDIDLSYRAVQKGYTILFEAKSIVRHYHEEGSIKEKFQKKYIDIIAYRNQFIFEMKHFPSLSQRFAFLFWTPLRLIQSLMRKDASMFIGFWKAIVRLYFT